VAVSVTVLADIIPSPLCVPHHLLLLHDSPGFGSGAGLADDPHTLLQGYRGHRPCGDHWTTVHVADGYHLFAPHTRRLLGPR